MSNFIWIANYFLYLNIQKLECKLLSHDLLASWNLNAGSCIKKNKKEHEQDAIVFNSFCLIVWFLNIKFSHTDRNIRVPWKTRLFHYFKISFLVRIMHCESWLWFTHSKWQDRLYHGTIFVVVDNVSTPELLINKTEEILCN